MKEGISIVGVFQIVILFILLFAGIMALTINNSNAFAVKNEIVNVVDLNSGRILDGDNLSAEIRQSIENSSYRNTGTCSKGFTGYDRQGKPTSGAAAICIRCIKVTDDVEKSIKEYKGIGSDIAEGNSLKSYYFQIQMFYQLDIPVMEQVFNFSTKGDTETIFSKTYPTMCK